MQEKMGCWGWAELPTTEFQCSAENKVGVLGLAGRMGIFNNGLST